MSKKSNSSNGLGFGVVLFLILLTLKLAEVGVVATWSWWWVTAPLWAPITVVLIFLIGMLFVVFLKAIRSK